MSQLLIQTYLNKLDELHKITGVKTEQVIRPAFRRLLDDWARSKNLIFVEELEYATPLKTKVYPDGTILHDLRVPLGFWEAKDTNDDLDTEIAKKLRKGYPQDNIIFENSEIAVLIQNRQEVTRCSMQDVEALERLVELFFSWERPEIAEFRKAVEQFKADLPMVLDALRARIDTAYAENEDFRAAADAFLAQAKQTINPSIGEADVREMLIQHILTEEIFTHVFNEGDFHRKNNIAKELYELEEKFFTGAVKRETLRALEPYYATIRSNAALITSHHEKQTFLKVIYENFYKVYNPKAADRLGVIYTPNEIVRFMIEGADWLCQAHFGKALIERDVEILDPATGTGTFICELLEHFRGQKDKLAYKYRNELHANEVAILPYYVANLNIEATYYGLTGQYAEFPNLCFVDTLDNTAGLGIRAGHQPDLFGALSEENVERIKRQNRRKISVIIGNPPYNANQKNENENNKNREYPEIDKRIKASYVRASTAQKTKLYDMYVRFFRWASDRLHDDGVLAFVSNNSFIDSRTFDGFRRTVEKEFYEIYIIDLKGNARTSGERRRREAGNIFDDQIRVGVSVSFLVKKKNSRGCNIRYEAVRDYAKPEEKRDFLTVTPLSQRDFRIIEPDKDANWIDLLENNWSALCAIADSKTKSAKSSSVERAIFKFYGNGVNTARDEWIISHDVKTLNEKVKYLYTRYNAVISIGETFDDNIKWSADLTKKSKSGVVESMSDNNISYYLYRPFLKMYIYNSPLFTERPGYLASQGGPGNQHVAFPNGGEFRCLAAQGAVDFHFIGDARVVSRYRYASSGERLDNITDWGLKQFQSHYGKDKKRPITKDAIFHYVYGVLHDPVYREKYALNLKREFPRMPFQSDFWGWAEWGERLMALHIGYETVEPWPLERIDTPDEKAREAGVALKAILKADRENGIIVLDSETQLTGVPPEAWTYRLGNRSALDWILDQYKEKTPRDPTIREKFNTYRFADYKEKVIDLLTRVTRVSVETMEIVGQMREATDLAE